MALAIWMAALAAAGATMGDGMDERDELLAKAMKSVRAAIPAAEKDPNRPTYHFRPPALWMNDPNGTIFHEGWYHLFYQHNPYGDGWGDMHWGHARSQDLVNWEHLPIALWPTKSKGEDHVFSGSTFVDAEGQAKIFYTSISDKRAPEQWIAAPLDKDWIGWNKPELNPVVSTKTHLPTDIQEWRDPFPFNEDGKTYMAVGGKLGGKGVVALYLTKNTELTEWEYKGILFTHPDADLVECPNLAKFGDKWVLLTSSHGKVESWVGKMGLEKPSFAVEKRGVLGEGSYASQLLTDKDGRITLTAWNRFEGNKGWNGCLTLPSVLTLAPDGTLLANPVETLKTLRASVTSLENEKLQGTLDLTEMVKGHALELVAEIDPQKASRIEIELGSFKVSYDPKTRTLTVPGRSPAVLRPSPTLKLHLFVDRSIFDVYADDGAVMQTVFKPLNDAPTAFKITAEGGEAKIVSIEFCSVRPAKFDLTKFK
ncbi:hypothetical protein EON81_07660 [bacterium]|nr:MAG: hypothetical protein EON81_07660 [bacterium]